MKQITGKVGTCSRCGAAVGLLISQRTGREYTVNLGRGDALVGHVMGSDTSVGVADFHKCNQNAVDAVRAAQPAGPVYAGIAKFFGHVISKGAKKLSVSINPAAGVKLTIGYKAGRDVLYVTDGRDFGNNFYFGAVDLATGSMRPGRDRMDAAHTALLGAFDADPVATAVLSARFTGSCSFCSRKLDDVRSIEVGYGPTCAEKYGMPWGAKRQGQAVSIVYGRTGYGQTAL